MQLLSQAEFDKATKDMDTCPEILKLDDGQGVIGVYLGAGPPVEMTDAAGDEKTVGTHVIETEDRTRHAIVSSHQLDKELPELKGKRVAIMKLGTEKTQKGRQVTKYRIKHAPN